MSKIDKIIIDKEKGTYLTVAQLRFFSNRPNALQKIKIEHQEYIDYCIACCAYNIISDYNNINEKSVLFYWTEEHGFYYSFNKSGDLANSLVECGFQLSGNYE